MEIISKSEAQKRANALRAIPVEVIETVNTVISNGFASGAKYVIYSKPDNMSQITWTALCDTIRAKGYTIKADSCQRDGQWVNIEL